MTFDSAQQHESEEAERSLEGDAQFAYHLERITRKFKCTISAENAELLLDILGPTWSTTR